ncbi:Hypp9425, partial [Branchiostoma lanceolatum]
MATRAKKPTKRRLEGSSISVDSSAGGKQRKPLSEKVANVQSPPVYNENSRVGRKKRGSVDAAEVNEISQEDIANLIQQTARDYGYNHDYTSILAVLKNPRDDRNRPLYKNSKVSQVEGVALVLASFALFPGASKEATSYLFYLLRNYLLPDGNCMPSSWDEARKLIDDLLTPKETIHVCVNDCVAFRKDRKDMKRCPVCKEDRYVSGTTRPRKKFHFLPLVPRLRRLYEIKAFSHLLSKHMDSGVANDIVRDIHDSPGWHRQFEQGGLFEGDPRHLLLQFCQDGMNPFDMRKNAYSMSPQLIKIMNLPMTAREKLGFLLLVGLIHGPKEPKNMDPYLEPLVDELLLLLEGVWAFDGLRKEAFQVKGKDPPLRAGLCRAFERYLEPDDPMRKDTSNFPDKAVEDRGPPRLRTAGEMETLSNLCNPETTAMPKTLLATVQKAAGKNREGRVASSPHVQPRELRGRHATPLAR